MTARTDAMDQIVHLIEDGTGLSDTAGTLASALQHEVADDGTSAPFWSHLADLLTLHTVSLLTAAETARRLADTAEE
jgi:hypothetical protein